MVFTKQLKMPSKKAWVERSVGLIKEGGGAQALKVICRVAKWEQRMFPRKSNICN
jgi:hypothetical protein